MASGLQLLIQEKVRQTPGHLLALIVFGLFLAVYIAYYTVFSPLRHIPGPFVAKLTRLWKWYHIYNGNFQEIEIQLHKKYGGLVRIGPNEVSASTTDAVVKEYSAGTKYRKTLFYKDLGKTDEPFDLFGERDEKKHAAYRRKVSNLYSMSNLMRFEKYMDECSQAYLQKFHDMSLAGIPVDISFWFQAYAFDVINQLTFGQRFGCIDDPSNTHKMFEEIEAFLSQGVFVSTFPELFHLKNLYLRIINCPNPFLSLFTFAAERIAQDTLQKNREKLAHEDYMLSQLLEKHHTGSGLSMDLVTLTSTSNVLAGSDTTGITLRAIIYFLCKNPRCMAKLQEEVRSAYESGKISHPVSFQAALELPYLQAVIKESLRLFPAVGLTLPRYVPAGGDTISGVWLPGGTTIGVNAWVIHREESIYGKDAEQFVPERWIVSSPEQLRAMEKNSLTFGSGARTCIGKNISLMEISKFIPSLLLNFDIELVNPGKEWTLKNRWFVKQTDIDCVFKSRALGRREQRETVV